MAPRKKAADLGTAERALPREMHEPMHEARGSEGHDQRATAADYTYRPPTNLDAPEPRPGYVQRWCRAAFRDGEDGLNWQARLGEGWTPRDPKSIPSNERRWLMNGKAKDGMITVGGLVLMEIDEQVMVAKRKWINEQTRRQEESVSMDTDRASQDGTARGHSPIQREHVTTASTGRRPPTLG